MADIDAPSQRGHSQGQRGVERKRRVAISRIATFTSLALAIAGGLVLAVQGRSAPVASAGTSIRSGLGLALVTVASILAGCLPVTQPPVLAIRWARMRDYRYALAAAGVVLVIGIGLTIKLWFQP